MEIKKALILILTVLLLTLVAGCSNGSDASLPVQVPSNDLNEMQEATLEYAEITDPVELEKLWQEYFYDTITTLGNSREFNCADEIEPLYVAKYCWYKYIVEHGQEGLELVAQDSYSRLFPLNIVLEYAGRYFDLDSLELTDIEDHYYNPEKRAFIFNYATEHNRPSYTDRNSWGTHLDKVTRNRDGTITVVLVNYDTYETRRVQMTKTYTLNQRKDGSLYFTSGRWEYVDNNLVSLTGDYRRFDKIAGFEGNINELFMLGEDNNQLIMANTPYDKKKNASLMLLDPESMKVEKELDLMVNVAFHDVRLTGEQIVVRLDDKVITIAKTLKQLEEIPLPQAIRHKIEREPKYDQYGLPDIYFGGYDVSSDLKSIAYADEQGVKLFNRADSSEILLSPTVPVKGSKLIRNYYHSSPRFIDHDKKVISTLLGYETAAGYTLCNLEEGTSRTYDITSEGSSTCFIRYDTGLLEINAYIREQAGQTAKHKTLFLDFESGEVQEIKLEIPDDPGIRDHNSCYVGQNYAAFLTCELDYDYANNMSYLNRLDLETLAAETKIVSVKAANTSILGVLADGRILFWYSLNPSEEGICITK